MIFFWQFRCLHVASAFFVVVWLKIGQMQNNALRSSTPMLTELRASNRQDQTDGAMRGITPAREVREDSVFDQNDSDNDSNYRDDSIPTENIISRNDAQDEESENDSDADSQAEDTEDESDTFVPLPPRTRAQARRSKSPKATKATRGTAGTSGTPRRRNYFRSASVR